MNQSPTKHPIAKGAEAGVIAGVIAMIAAGLAGLGAENNFWEFPQTVANALSLSDGAVAIVVGLVVHLALSAFFGAVYAYLAHQADFDRFESIVPLFLGAMIYSAFLYLLTFTMIIGLFFPDAAESSVAVSMSMVFVFSVTLVFLLWRPRVSYEQLNHGAKDIGVSEDKG